MIKQNRFHSFCSIQQGLTMIELMIAMLLGLLLMGGMVQIFVGSKKSYNIQEAQSRLQENARLAMSFLPYDVRLADFHGCASMQQNPPNIIADATVDCPTNKDCAPPLDISLFQLKSGITGEDNIQTGTAAAKEGGQDVFPGTDKLQVQYAGNCDGYLVGNYDPENANIKINGSNTCDIKHFWPYMISDCASSHIFRAESRNKNETVETISHPESVNSDTKLNHDYKQDAEIFSIQQMTYYISKNPAGNKSLYRREHLSGINEELVEGVEDMQILYGEDSDGDNTANYYVDASSFPVDPATGKRAMGKVKSVKISLLLHSLSDINVTGKPVPYQYNGVKVTAVDQQLWKVFTTTIGLRNRLP